LREIRDLITFFTIIPLGKGRIEGAAKYFFLSPLVVGGLVGGLSGLIGLLLSLSVKGFLPGMVALFTSFLLTGFHHLDGLMDFSDALMAHGSVENRVKALHDKYPGSAAIASAVLNISASLMAVSKITGMDLLMAFIAAEIASRCAALTVLYLGPPASFSKLGLTFSKEIYGKHGRYSLGLFGPLIALYVVLRFKGVIMILVSFLIGIILDILANKTINGVSGDVCGAAIEISRTATLLIFC